jgi:hypothetical protein
MALLEEEARLSFLLLKFHLPDPSFIATSKMESLRL